MSDGLIYIIHFDRPYVHARHYVGWAKHVGRRMQQHESGKGARLLEVCNQAGIKYEVVFTIPGTRSDERRIKRTKEIALVCPLCRPHRLAQKRADQARRRQQISDGARSLGAL